MMRGPGSHAATSLDLYLAEISRYELLSADEERALARRYRDGGDSRAAHHLVTANLRFVAKVAYEYRSYGFRMADLVQEGNIGLMRAVQKFDPDKGIRLISYGVWWIRAYIQNHILRSWSLVKLGTTQAQRKLFFSMGRTRRELERASAASGLAPTSDAAGIAARLRVKAEEVAEMQQRMEGRDLSLDAPLGEDGSTSHVDLLCDAAPGQENELGVEQERRLTAARVALALGHLDERERYIVESRLMGDRPMTLAEIGDHFGFSRERARQLEIRAKEKLRRELQALTAEIDWPRAEAPDAPEELAVG
jgi:RNA polymerase sigma-32 factor